ncbi:MAG TPA: hypothetical protein EYP56_20480 [Planctomycetaceae bacterium]|nr:hypothetical protein [Planctomycetaceae bacterium]
MRNVLISALGFCVALAVALSPAAGAQPADQPIAVISFAGYDALKRDGQLIAEALGQPDAIQKLEMFLVMATQGRGLAGLDKTRPWGVVITAIGPPPAGYLFLPVTDLAPLVALAAGMGGRGRQPPQPVDGVYEIPAGEQKLYATQKGQWALVANDRSMLSKAPADPGGLLGGLGKQYLLAARVHVKNIPAPLKQTFIDLNRSASQQQGADLAAQFPWLEAIRARMAERRVREIERMINETDTLTLGLAVDPSTKSLHVDFIQTAIPGTTMAELYKELADTRSDFGGFFDADAPFSVHTSGKMAPNDIEAVRQLVAEFRAKALKDIRDQELSDSEKAAASQFVNQLLDVVDATAEGGRSDFGLSLRFASGAVTLVAGLHIEKGDTLDQVVKRLANMMTREQPALAERVKLDAEQRAGVSFHTLTLPAEVLGENGPPPELFGGDLTVVLGIGPQTLCLAVGANALESLKQALEGSQAAGTGTVPPVRFSASLSSLADLVQAVAPELPPGAAEAVLAAMKQAAPRDHIRGTSKAVPNGVHGRMEVEEGVIKAVAAIARNVQQMIGPAGVQIGPAGGGFGPP